MLDTKQLHDRLNQHYGFTDLQAEGVLEAVRAVHEDQLQTLATKGDLKKLEGRIFLALFALFGALSGVLAFLERI